MSPVTDDIDDGKSKNDETRLEISNLERANQGRAISNTTTAESLAIPAPNPERAVTSPDTVSPVNDENFDESISDENCENKEQLLVILNHDVATPVCAITDTATTQCLTTTVTNLDSLA